MTQFKDWNADDFDWTMEIWQHDRMRYEWDTSLSPHRLEQEDWLRMALLNRQRTPLCEVVLTDAGEAMGLIMLDTVDWKNRSIRLRATLLPTALERIDYMLDMLKRLIKYAFLQENMYRLWILTGEDTPDHHDALNELGFVMEARRRQAIYRNGAYEDELSWSLLRTNWQGNN